MFNKQQINALWAKINAKYGATNDSPTHKSSSVSELQTMISEGTLIPGTVYSYDVGIEENSVTIYQKAITPNTLDTNGILVSDNDKYNGVDVDFDVTKCPTDTSLLVVMSSDKSNLYIYEDGELSDIAANIGVTENGAIIFKRIPKNNIPESITSGTYLIRVEAAGESNPSAYYGGIAIFTVSNNTLNWQWLTDSNNGLWTVKDNKFTTQNPVATDEVVAIMDDAIHQFYSKQIETFTNNRKIVSIDEIPVITSIIDQDYTGA